MTTVNLTQLSDLGPEARPEPKRDRYGRYMIPDPDTGKERSWTRATTWSSSVADTYGLTKWQLRMAAVGLAQRSDLYAQVASSVPVDLDVPTKDEKRKLDNLVEAAKEHAGSSRRANLGTALHSFCEAVDLGRDVTIPHPWDADVTAYRRCLTDAGIEVVEVEQVVVVPELGVAGMFDRVVRYDGRLPISDLKTGRDLSYSWTEIAIQLALYAHARTIWDLTTQTHRPMPEVDQERALVMHAPVGQARCDLYEVDIAAGWEMAQVCGIVRDWRKRKNLATKVVAVVAPASVEAPTPAPDPFAGLPDENGAPQFDRAEKRTWLEERIDGLRAIDGGLAALASNWPAGVPTLKKSTEHTHDQMLAIQAAVSEAEQTVVAPFPERNDPTDQTLIRVEADDERAVDMRRRFACLPNDLQLGITTRLKGEKIPSLSSGNVTEAQLPGVEALLADAETTWAPRCQTLAEAFDGIEDLFYEPDAPSMAQVELIILRQLNVSDLMRLGPESEELFIAICEAIRTGVLIVRDGALVIEQAAPILERLGRQGTRDTARRWTKHYGLTSPASAIDALADPILVALLATEQPAQADA